MVVTAGIRYENPTLVFSCPPSAPAQHPDIVDRYTIHFVFLLLCAASSMDCFCMISFSVLATPSSPNRMCGGLFIDGIDVCLWVEVL